ncbi:hypothetical protein MNBD_BACTEROID05-86, partial [hydrothermal vent metagenome]
MLTKYYWRKPWRYVMRKETEKVVQAVVFGCVVGIFMALFLVKGLGLSPLWAVLLGAVSMVGAA